MREIIDYNLFHLGTQDITVGQVILFLLISVMIFLLYRLLLRTYSPQLFESTELKKAEKQKLGRIFRGLALLCLLLAIVTIFELNYKYITSQGKTLSVRGVLGMLLFLQFARFIYWIVVNTFINGYYARRDLAGVQKGGKQEGESKISAHKTFRLILFLLVGIYALRNFNVDYTLFSRVIGDETLSFNVSNILQAILIIAVARLIIWVITQLVLYRVYNNRDVALGSQYAINQLIKYVVYVFAIIMALDLFGINMNILLGGAAALLVGIGLGLQQTFNDFISGLVLLFERSVSVGDVLEVDGQVGRVKEIGLRASTLETRENTRLVLPNHFLVNHKVVNWNHHNSKVRFELSVGVAYGTDTMQVKQLLLKSLEDVPFIEKFPPPFVRFQSFSDSSLDFTLYFFSKNLMAIADIKSDIRLKIDRLFRANEINIPFPQREIRIIKDSSDEANPSREG